MGFFSSPPVLSLPGVKPRTQTAEVLPWAEPGSPCREGRRPASFSGHAHQLPEERSGSRSGGRWGGEQEVSPHYSHCVRAESGNGFPFKMDTLGNQEWGTWGKAYKITLTHR